MGQSSSSKDSSSSSPKAPPTPKTASKIRRFSSRSGELVDRKIGKFLVSRLTAGNRVKTFTKIVLKLPLVGEKFSKISKVFREFDTDNNGTIDYAELSEALVRLGATDISPELSKEIFQSSDMYSNSELTFKEFIVCLALGYLLEVIPVSEDEDTESLTAITVADRTALQEAFAVAADCFLLFDEDASGTITIDEMETTLASMGMSSPTKRTQKRSGSNTNSSTTSPASEFTLLSQERFKELDWDEDGSITFKEFLFAFVGWTDAEQIVEDELEEAVSS